MRTVRDYDEELRVFVEAFLRFDTTGGGEAPAQAWLRGRLEELGFETIEWTADAERLAEHPSFPDDPDDIPVEDRPSVAGVLEFGDPDAGPTFVLNGHTDVVPAEGSTWTSDPFEPTWDARGERLTARGAVDMKSNVAACVFAARTVADAVEAGAVDLDGRLVVESVAGEEDGGIGAAAAALDSPYDFERDAALVAEPTDMNVVVATEGCVMKRLEVAGRSAHAARRWRGEDVLPRFEAVRRAFAALESERAERVSHPLYERFDCPWPITVGTVRAGSWASSVADTLVAECRLGVAPGETVAEVEAEYEDALQTVVDDDEWLSAHPPAFDRFSVQFAPAEIDPAEPVVAELQAALRRRGRDTTPVGETYGADNRHYVDAGIPSVVFGPGRIDEAHYPDETLLWADLLDAGAVIAETARTFLERG